MRILYRWVTPWFVCLLVFLVCFLIIFFLYLLPFKIIVTLALVCFSFKWETVSRFVVPVIIPTLRMIIPCIKSMSPSKICPPQQVIFKVINFVSLMSKTNQQYQHLNGISQVSLENIFFGFNLEQCKPTCWCQLSSLSNVIPRYF